VTIVIDNVADPATFDRYFPALARGARVVISGAIGSPQPPVLRVPADTLYLRSIALLGVRTASTRVVQDFLEPGRPKQLPTAPRTGARRDPGVRPRTSTQI